MTRSVLALVASVFILTAPSSALAGSDVWYTTPEEQGDCGDECYTAPHAWIDQIGGNHAFGVSCQSTMVLGGPAMEVSELPFSQAMIQVDGKSQGLFSIDSGLNDVFVTPAATNGITLPNMKAALASGSALQIDVEGRSPIKFTLKGSKAAIREMERLCKN